MLGHNLNQIKIIQVNFKVSQMPRHVPLSTRFTVRRNMGPANACEVFLDRPELLISLLRTTVVGTYIDTTKCTVCTLSTRPIPPDPFIITVRCSMPHPTRRSIHPSHPIPLIAPRCYIRLWHVIRNSWTDQVGPKIWLNKIKEMLPWQLWISENLHLFAVRKFLMGALFLFINFESQVCFPQIWFCCCGTLCCGKIYGVDKFASGIE